MSATCTACALFVDAVKGLRGAQWQDIHCKGIKHRFTSGAVRGEGDVVGGKHVPDMLRDQHAVRWLAHLDSLSSIERRAHLSQLPAWVRELLERVDFNNRRPREDAETVAAAVVGVPVGNLFGHRSSQHGRAS